MTRSVPTPLRPYTQDWPGLNTRGGRTMRVGGEMEDCTNVIINEGDILSKRTGFVRGLDERFDGVVCGLFSYADDCGNEYLLVADQVSIKIRRPFTQQGLQTLDCYPQDDFEEGTELNPDEWRNTSRYIVTGGECRLGAALQESSLTEGILNAARWFKEACRPSYQTTAQFTVDSSADQRVLLVIRGSGDLSGGALILASLEYRSSAPDLPYLLRLVHRAAGGATSETKSEFSASSTGFISLRYDATTRTPSVQTTISGGGTQTLTLDPLEVVEDTDLGLVSAMGLGQTGATFPSGLGILQIFGSRF